MEISKYIFVLVFSFLTLFVQDSSAVSCEFTGNGTGTCSDCVGFDISCFYCEPTKSCAKRSSVVVSKSECSGKWYTYSQCTIPGVVLIIIAPVAAVLFLVFMCCCVYCICCRDCCRERNKKKWAKDDSRRENRKNEREAKHAARDEERKLKHDQIRAKYGLFNKDEPPTNYQRFDNS